MKIICVDDDPVFLSILEDCLAAQGYGRVRAFQQSVEVAILAEAGRLTPVWELLADRIIQ